ncbi:DUF4192 family protein [Rhodococcoides kroppenstedtii]|uniref:DUF4192 family protein n=1 Tax=Rhodococcoides kroppenstedtii TaxID=293050 RepID=UPI0028EBA7D5|nr:DUF4192 family protein [Rhodococcus kroppenstedtii]
MTQRRITISTAADLIAAVPALVRFVPTDSIVVIALTGTAATFTVRIDRTDVDTQTDRIVDALTRHRTTAVHIVSVSDHADKRAATTEHLILAHRLDDHPSTVRNDPHRSDVNRTGGSPEHPRQPVAQGHSVVEESFGDVLRHRQSGGDAGGALGVRIDRPLVAVFFGEHQVGMQGGGMAVASPFQVRRSGAEVGQGVEVPDHRQVERRRQAQRGRVTRRPRRAPHLRRVCCADPPIAHVFDCSETHRHDP